MAQDTLPTRRGLLLGTAATVAVGCAPTPSLKDSHPETAQPDTDTGPPDTGPFDTGPFDTAVPQDCAGTPPLDAGPYYRADAPERTDLRTLGEEGTVLHLAFQIRSAADCRLLPGSVLELWHAQQDGLYDMNTAEMHYRCRVAAGEHGRVVLTTLRPPGYGEAEARIQAHLHLTIDHPDHRRLITQLRFMDDPDDDGSTPPALYLEPEADGPGQRARFTFFLDAKD